MSAPGLNHESEIKLALPDAAAGRKLLRRHGFRLYRRRVLERNLVFDQPDGELRAGGRLLRLRTVGRRRILTFKGPPLPSRHKLREEIETEIPDPDAFELILRRLGYQVTFRYEKYRAEYREPGGRGTATLDETPIGVFLELEGPSDWIDSTAGRLGYSDADYITESYGALYLAHCRRGSIAPTHMVFPVPGTTDSK